MTLRLRVRDGAFFKSRPTSSAPVWSIDLDREPSPTVSATGIRSAYWGQHWLEEDDVPPLPDATPKPPFRVPTMEEVRALPWNGLTVVSTFAGAGGSSVGYRMAGFRVLWASEFVDAAREVYGLNARAGTVVDGRDVREVKGAEILAATGLEVGELDVLDGSPPCFVAGTLILTRRGLVPVEQVTTKDEVITHAGRWRRVTSTMSREADAITVRGQGHPGIGTTAEHPFMVRQSTPKWDNSARTNLRDFSEPDWRAIGACLPSKEAAFFWGMPREYPADALPEVCRANARSAAISLTQAFFWLVGLWLGDGWLRTGRAHVATSRRGEVLICANKKQAADVRLRIEEAGLPFSEAEMRTTIRFTICHAGLADWLEEDFGRGARGKTVPTWAFGMPEEWRRALLEGYVFADGTRPRDGYFRTTSVSWSLTLGIAMIARTLGIATSLRCQTYRANNVIENRKVNVAESVYALDCYAKPRSFLIDLDRCWGRVKEVTAAGRATVYNISVDEDESYLADGLIVHNCASFSTAGKRQAHWGQARKYSDRVQRTDDLFFEFARIRDELMPRVFVAENVSGLVKGAAKGFFKEIFRRLKDGYRVEARMLDAQWLGVPQQRQRVIYVGVREDLDVEPAFPSPLPYRYSVREAIPWIGRVQQGRQGDFRKEGQELTDAPSKTVLGTQPLQFDMTDARMVAEPHGNMRGLRRSVDEPAPAIRNAGGAGPYQCMVEERVVQGPEVDQRNQGRDLTDGPAPAIVAGDAEKRTPRQLVVERVVHDTGRGRPEDVTDKVAPTVTVGGGQSYSKNSNHFRVEGGEPEGRVIPGDRGGRRRREEKNAFDLDGPLPNVLADGGRNTERAQFIVEQPAHDVRVGANGPFGRETYQSADLPARTIGAGPTSGNGRSSAGDLIVPAVEPESDISRFAIGREADRLGPGEQSDKYFQLVRAHPEQPSPAVTACGGGSATFAQKATAASVIHPTEKRKFSIAELKRICGFLDDFVLTGSYGQQWERLGRAVPPPMMRAIAEALRDRILVPARERGRAGG